MEAMDLLIPLLSNEALQGEVMSLALSKGDVAGSLASRAICARIMGAVAPCMVREQPAKPAGVDWWGH